MGLGGLCLLYERSGSGRDDPLSGSLGVLMEFLSLSGGLESVSWLAGHSEQLQSSAPLPSPPLPPSSSLETL